MSHKKRRILLTGSLGFLGRALVRWCPTNVDLTITDLPERSPLPTEFTYRKLDIRTCSSRDFEGFDTVIHNAGLFDLSASKERLHTINVEGCRRVAQYAIEAGIKQFVQISSTSIYGVHPTKIFENTEPKTPIHAYGESKWLGEKTSESLCRDADIRWLAIRPTLIYGSDSRYGIAPMVALIDGLIQRFNRILLPKAGPMVHVVHADDVARAVWHLLEVDAEGEFNVADEHPLTFGDLLKAISHHLGSPSRSIPVPWRLLRKLVSAPVAGPRILRMLERSGRPRDAIEGALSPRIDQDWHEFIGADFVFDIQRLLETGFKFKYPSVSQGLPDTIAKYRLQGWLPNRL